jgi:hypothetical protein
MNCLPKSAATRRYTRRFLPTMGLYVIFLFIAAWVFPHYHPTGVPAYLLAILPALPIIAVIGIIGLYLAEEKDEFQRNLLIQSMIWAMGGTLVVTTAWGFLEAFITVPHFQLYLVFPLFWFFVGISTGLLKLRYR